MLILNLALTLQNWQCQKIRKLVDLGQVSMVTSHIMQINFISQLGSSEGPQTVFPRNGGWTGKADASFYLLTLAFQTMLEKLDATRNFCSCMLRAYPAPQKGNHEVLIFSGPEIWQAGTVTKKQPMLLPILCIRCRTSYRYVNYLRLPTALQPWHVKTQALRKRILPSPHVDNKQECPATPPSYLYGRWLGKLSFHAKQAAQRTCSTAGPLAVIQACQDRPLQQLTEVLRLVALFSKQSTLNATSFGLDSFILLKSSKLKE